MKKPKVNEIEKLKNWIFALDGDPDDEKQVVRRLRALVKKAYFMGSTDAGEMEYASNSSQLLKMQNEEFKLVFGVKP